MRSPCRSISVPDVLGREGRQPGEGIETGTGGDDSSRCIGSTAHGYIGGSLSDFISLFLPFGALD